MSSRILFNLIMIFICVSWMSARVLYPLASRNLTFSPFSKAYHCSFLPSSRSSRHRRSFVLSWPYWSKVSWCARPAARFCSIYSFANPRVFPHVYWIVTKQKRPRCTVCCCLALPILKPAVYWDTEISIFHAKCSEAINHSRFFKQEREREKTGFEIWNNFQVYLNL